MSLLQTKQNLIEDKFNSWEPETPKNKERNRNKPRQRG